jgi:uncharacterized protein
VNSIQNHQKKCVLLFVKYPEKGCVKTRLCTELDQQVVATLYQKFILDTLDTLKHLKLPFVICFSPKKEYKKLYDWLGETYQYIPQIGKDLGEKMSNAFQRSFNQGYEQVILIGSDSPDLPVKIFVKAFDMLASNDIVLGPASDGGYYLIGFQKSQFLSSVFKNISWSTPAVFKETEKKIRHAGKTMHLLPIWDDIDTMDDVKNIIKRNQNTSFQNSKTMLFLTDPKNRTFFSKLFVSNPSQGEEIHENNDSTQ